MELNEEEGLECEVQIEEICLEPVLEFKCIGCVLDESGRYGTEYSRKVVSGRRVAGTTWSLANAKDLQLACARVLHETLLVPVLMYCSEIILWKERSSVRELQLDNLRGLLGIKRKKRVPNAQIREE